MSTAPAAEAAPPAKGKKKLIIIIIAVAALVLAGIGSTAVVLMKKKAAQAETEAEADGEADTHAPAKAAVKHDPKDVPVFVPLDAFTVNLADRDAERFAQIGITLEIADTQTGERIKIMMPAIRNNILMTIADRTASELLGREGKTKLAEKMRRETSKVLGADVPDDEEMAAADEESAKTDKAGARKPKKKKKAVAEMPVKAVHFSNFIIQ